MKSKTNAGYDNILTQLINQFVESIALPLKTMFNSMIRSGIFPNDLIIAKDSPNPVMPVFFFYKLQAHLTVTSVFQNLRNID